MQPQNIIDTYDTPTKSSKFNPRLCDMPLVPLPPGAGEVEAFGRSYWGSGTTRQLSRGPGKWEGFVECVEGGNATAGLAFITALAPGIRHLLLRRHHDDVKTWSRRSKEFDQCALSCSISACRIIDFWVHDVEMFSTASVWLFYTFHRRTVATTVGHPLQWFFDHHIQLRKVAATLPEIAILAAESKVPSTWKLWSQWKGLWTSGSIWTSYMPLFTTRAGIFGGVFWWRWLRVLVRYFGARSSICFSVGPAAQHSAAISCCVRRRNLSR